MSNELAAQIPEYLKKYQSTGNDADFGEIDSSDLGINMLKIGQSNSRECKKPGWGVTGQEPQIPQKTMFLSKDGKIIPSGTMFIPLIRTVKYIHWIGKPGEGRIDFMCDDKNDERIKKIDGLAFRKDPNSGETLSPLVTKYINFYVMLQGFDLPILFSFKRTSIPDGKSLTQSTMMAAKQNNLPMHMLVYTLGEPKTVVDGTLDWYAFTFRPSGFTPDEVAPKAKKMTEFARNLTQLFGAKEYESIERSDSPDGLRPVQGADVTPQAPPAPAAPPPPMQQQTVTMPPPAQQQQVVPPPAATQFGAPPPAPAPQPVQQQPAPVQTQAAPNKLW